MNITKKNKFKKLVLKVVNKEFLKYLLVGSTSVLLDLLSLFLFVEIFQFPLTASVIINQIIVYLYVFSLNKVFVFRVKGDLARQILRYTQLALFNYIISVFWMYFFGEICQQNYLLVRISNIILATIWNFLLYRAFVYKKIK